MMFEVACTKLLTIVEKTLCPLTLGVPQCFYWNVFEGSLVRFVRKPMVTNRGFSRFLNRLVLRAHGAPTLGFFIYSFLFQSELALGPRRTNGSFIVFLKVGWPLGTWGPTFSLWFRMSSWNRCALEAHRAPCSFLGNAPTWLLGNTHWEIHKIIEAHLGNLTCKIVARCWMCSKFWSRTEMFY